MILFKIVVHQFPHSISTVQDITLVKNLKAVNILLNVSHYEHVLSTNEMNICV